MKKRLLFILLSLFLLLVAALPALAAAYSASLVLTNNSTTVYSMLSVNVSMSNDSLVSSNLISSSGNSTRVKQAATELPHMLADNSTLFALPTAANTQYLLTYYTGETALSSFPIIVGYSGNVTVSDNSTLELGGNFRIIVSGWVNTALGANKNLIYKSGAFQLSVSGNITVTLNGTTTVSVASLDSAEYVVTILLSDGTFSLQIDSETPVTTSFSGNVTDNDNAWYFFQDNSMPYVNYVKVWK